jgi:hypothetical protein
MFIILSIAVIIACAVLADVSWVDYLVLSFFSIALIFAVCYLIGDLVKPYPFITYQF